MDQPEAFLSRSNDCFGSIVLKNSKIAGTGNLANVARWRLLPLQGAVESIRGPAQEFSDETTLPGPRNPVETLSGLPSPKTKRGSVMMEATIAALLFVSAAVFFAHAYDAIQKD
jgi:hypothetical protein